MATEYISRDEVHVQIDRALCCGLPYHRTIDEIPAADVRPVVRGEWVVDSIASNIFSCSVCGCDAPVEPTGGTEYKSNFCPCCGADMRGEGGSAYVAEPLQAQPQDKKTKNVIHLWMEGYDCNGNHAMNWQINERQG